MCETFGILDLHGCMIIPCILDISISIACRLAFDYLACHLNNARFIPLNTPLKKVRGLWSVEILFLFLSFCWVITQGPVKWFSVFPSSWSPWYCISNPIKCWNFFFSSNFSYQGCWLHWSIHNSSFPYAWKYNHFENVKKKTSYGQTWHLDIKIVVVSVYDNTYSLQSWKFYSYNSTGCIENINSYP